ncbi:putative peptide ABC transporter DppA [Actinoplanes italicus]|uniref:Peptide/nickel transport system substrate-binding protein/oligopeptide transport system substrate-binding protein n=1 Tax=Actinoplanes italicus TaxID=113567 RepID=A0A2T0KPY9_9ACTN|nr:ABC transporter substrate-binding protein [Actinoplanes italicus]PRX25798.1 peptide/nickel transport system substrate-binding protein/oligopeptide transport system substrate-binding protein [Actinoplanes italicus]GIE28751.1 putative peptide ABC transporter DppA [Actinoplanes italicus]
MLGKRPWKMAAATAAISLLVAGCAGSDSEDPALSANAVVISIAEPQHLLPTNATDSSSAQVLSSLFYPLVSFDAEKKPVEVAAEKISVAKGNKVWTIKIKPGFTFHNGEPVTAQNYIDAWNYGAYGPNAQSGGYFFDRIEGYADLNPIDPDKDGPEKAPKPTTNVLSGLKKVDDLTFTVTLSAPFASFKSVIAYSVFHPLPNAAFSSPGVIAKGFEEKLIGNGPFKMKGKWEHDDKIVVEKYSDFKGVVPKIDGVTWKIYGDQMAAYADLVSGNLDVQTTIPTDALANAPADLGERYLKSENSVFEFIGFPTFLEQYKSADVRKAISMAINRDEIASQVFLGSRTAAKSFVSPVVSGYREGSCGEACDYNPTKARDLYREAKGPAEIKITYNVDGGHKSWVDATCNQIRAALQVKCIGEQEPKFAVMQDKLQAKQDIGLIRLGWIMDYPLMENYLNPLYGTNGGSNYYGWSNTTFDSLVKQGSQAATPEQSIKKWQQAENILAEEMPVIPLRYGQNVFGHSERVANVEMDLFSKVNLYEIETIA